MNHKKFFLPQLIFVFFVTTISSCTPHIEMKNGFYTGYLAVNDSVHIPATLLVNSDSVFLVNGSEKMALQKPVWQNDTFFIDHPVFDSYLALVKNKDGYCGFWQDRSRPGNYKIDIVLNPGASLSVTSETFSNYLCTFDTGANAYPALLKLGSNQNHLTATFLTETGDYRYLHGNLNDKGLFRLGCFDGSHAFLFTGQLSSDSVSGKFYSGSHWQTTWYGTRNNTAQLASAFGLTKITDKGPIFKIIDTKGRVLINFQEKPYKHKPVVLQIMGSWCPNCLDETRYLTYMHKQQAWPPTVALGFERGGDNTVGQARIDKVKKNLQVPYPMLYAGEAAKDSAAAVLPFLNNIISFPTTVFLNSRHEIVAVHTGFNGPATGKIYQEQSAEIEAIIKRLMIKNP